MVFCDLFVIVLLVLFWCFALPSSVLRRLVFDFTCCVVRLWFVLLFATDCV